jgi:hypothetical protein
MPHTPLENDGTASETEGSTLEPFASVVVTYDDAPDECTIYPTDVDEDELVTRWISAEEGSYVRLEGMR